MHIIYRKAQPTLSNRPCRKVSISFKVTSLLDVFLPLTIHGVPKPGRSVARPCGNDVGHSRKVAWHLTHLQADLLRTVI